DECPSRRELPGRREETRSSRAASRGVRKPLHGHKRFSCSCQNLLHHPACLPIRDSLLLAVMEVSQLAVIEAEEVEERGMIVVRADRIHHGLVAELVCLAVGDAAFDSAAGQPTAEALA